MCGLAPAAHRGGDVTCESVSVRPLILSSLCSFSERFHKRTVEGPRRPIATHVSSLWRWRALDACRFASALARHEGSGPTRADSVSPPFSILGILRLDIPSSPFRIQRRGGAIKNEMQWPSARLGPRRCRVRSRAYVLPLRCFFLAASQWSCLRVPARCCCAIRPRSASCRSTAISSFSAEPIPRKRPRKRSRPAASFGRARLRTDPPPG